MLHYKGEVDHFRGELADKIRKHLKEKESMEIEMREKVEKGAQASKLKLERMKRQVIRDIVIVNLYFRITIYIYIVTLAL